MHLSATHLELIGQSQPGQLRVALHPTKREVLIMVEGTTVVLGMTEEQVTATIETLTNLRDRLVCRLATTLPHKPTPHIVPQ